MVHRHEQAGYGDVEVVWYVVGEGSSRSAGSCLIVPRYNSILTYITHDTTIRIYRDSSDVAN